MADQSFAAIRPIGEDDLDACLALSEEARWNQTADDWTLFFRHGWPVGIEDGQGRLVASAAALPLGPSLAWISMVLVTERARRNGLATKLLNDRIAAIEASGRHAGLDATPAGRTVYEPLGFDELFALTRMRGTPHGIDQPDPPGLRSIARQDIPALAVIDGQGMGGSRRAVLTHLLARRPDIALTIDDAGTPGAFCLGRQGRTAVQLGPVVAADPALGEALVRAALKRLAGQTVIIDLNDKHDDLRRYLETLGFSAERPFYRMVKGQPPAHWPAHYIAAAGPELA